jgi:hypothetical protein
MGGSEHSECISERSTGRKTSPKASFNGPSVTMNVLSLSEQRTSGGNRVISGILRRRPLLLFVIQRRLFSTRSSILTPAQIFQSSEIAEVEPGPFDGRLLGTVPSGDTLTHGVQ